ncbi:MAG: MBL fold metallo-hydrolase [Lachnospiraceae bacterium]|jgi:hydroxyacylglutathione hydrolase|nr:MBL fold metallo-hydrolase [Lachnospiraceae bacterium]
MEIKTAKISDFIYDFTEWQPAEDGSGLQPYVDSYLVIGSRRAAVIDTLQNKKGLYEAVRKLTDLPVDVLITHGHLDHCGISTKEFAEAGCRIFMCLSDYDLLMSMVQFPEKKWFTDLHDGDRFDLGGRVLETIACGGHSPGSVVFLDRAEQIMFSGDSIGSANFWMQLPSCLPLHEFQKNLSRLAENVSTLDRLQIYPGHRAQAPAALTGQYIKDTLTLTKLLVQGETEGADAAMDIDGVHIDYKIAALGTMLNFCYDPKNL